MPRLKTPRLVTGTRIAVASEPCVPYREIIFSVYLSLLHMLIGIFLKLMHYIIIPNYLTVELV